MLSHIAFSFFSINKYIGKYSKIIEDEKGMPRIKNIKQISKGFLQVLYLLAILLETYWEWNFRVKKIGYMQMKSTESYIVEFLSIQSITD